MAAARITTLLLAALLFLPAGPASAGEALPDQMIYGALEGDPVSDPRSAPVRLEMSILRLPDQRQARIHRLSWWTRIGGAHAAQVALDYVGVEGGGSFRYGGGRSLVRWTSRILPASDHGLAIDLAGNLPLGDETLFPLSARAPMGMFRVRASLLRVGFARIWAGWWARRVSPPTASNRQDPLSGFASGSGIDALMEWRLARVDVDWMLHLPTGGPAHRAFRWTVDTDWWLSRELALRVGAGLDTGPVADRSVDWTAKLGATWRPVRDD